MTVWVLVVGMYFTKIDQREVWLELATTESHCEEMASRKKAEFQSPTRHVSTLCQEATLVWPPSQ